MKQAGSIVTPDLLRFDFSHFEPMTAADLKTVETMINEKIWSNAGVTKRVMKKDQAIAAGAIAFFGEKYGDEVRVVQVGDYSTELCGGSHVNTSSDINLFKIVSETGIAAGVRRIIAYTSENAFDYLNGNLSLLQRARDLLKAPTLEETPEKIERTLASERDLRKQIESFRAREQGNFLDTAMKSAVDAGGVQLVPIEFRGGEATPQSLRELGDQLKSKSPRALGIFLVHEVGKTQLAIAAGNEAQKTLGANVLLKSLLPLIDGRGGGKPDFAQAGGTKSASIDALMSEAKALLNVR